MNNNAAATTEQPGHEEMSTRIERAALENMAGAVPLPPGMAPPEPPAPVKKYPYSEEDAAGHAENVAVVLSLWSSRWQRVEPLSATEVDKLSHAVGRWIAWKFPGNGEEVHPTMAIFTAAGAVALPRVYQLYLHAQAEKAAAEENAKKEAAQGPGNATAH